MKDRVVIKTLTRNDLGLNGSHQAGILVPKSIVDLGFFPELEEDSYNPHISISFDICGKKYVFNYIHYNNRVFGSGTRNEYRLTRLSQFFREFDCHLGDKLKFSYNEGRNQYSISVIYVAKEVCYSLEHPLVIHADWAY